MMDILAAVELKSALEKEITSQIRAFEIQTGLSVKGIMLFHDHAISGERHRVINTQVRVEL